MRRAAWIVGGVAAYLAAMSALGTWLGRSGAVADLEPDLLPPCSRILALRDWDGR